MRQHNLAYYIWDFLRRHDGERSELENWLLAESLLTGNRPAWLFGQGDFRPFGTFEEEFKRGEPVDLEMIVR